MPFFLAGMPTQISFSPVDSSKTAFAPITEPAPMVIVPDLQRSFAPAERMASFSMVNPLKSD